MTTRFADHLLSGDHSSRPAATAVPTGTLYSCSDHDLVYQSDGAAWSTWATVGGEGGGGGSTVPEWMSYLAERQSDETPHADDDFYDSDSSGDYTTQTVSGAASWAISRGVLSASASGTSTADWAAFLKAITSASAPMTIETRVRSLVLDQGADTLVALLFTNGTTTSSAIYGIYLRFRDTTSAIRVATTEGTLTANSTDTILDETVDRGAIAAPIYLRVTWVSANVFAASYSIDGVTWTDLGISDDARTLTPTHIGFALSVEGADPDLFTFDYLRVYDSDLSL